MSVRILHVVESLVPEAGSVAISLQGLSTALKARGVESTTVSADGVEGCPTDREQAARLVAQADVVHLHGWGYALANAAATASVRASKRLIVSPHGAMGNGAATGARWRQKVRGFFGGDRVVRDAAAIVTLNAAEETGLAGMRHNGRIVLLPYGINLGDYDGEAPASVSSPAAPEGRCVLMLGPIHPREGFVALLKALFELGPASDGWSVVLAGPEIGEWRKELEPAIRRKGGADRVLFTPASDVDTQRAWLSRASILASPSLQIGCGVGVLQAVASGVPVLASTLCAPPGLFDVIKTCGPVRHELVRALRQLLDMSDDERADLARKAREKARSTVDWSTLVEQYLNLYTK